MNIKTGVYKMKTKQTAVSTTSQLSKQDLYENNSYVKLNNYSEDYLNFCANFAESRKTGSVSAEITALKKQFVNLTQWDRITPMRKLKKAEATTGLPQLYHNLL